MPLRILEAAWVRWLLRSDNGGLAYTIIGYHATQLDDPVAHDDVQPERTPIIFFQRSDNTIANMVVIRCRIGYFARQIRNRLK